MISANGVEYKNLPEQVQYLTEKAAEFAVELDRVSASVDSVAGDVAALQTSYTTLAEDMRVAKININTLYVNFGTAFTEITNIKNGTTHLFETITDRHGNPRFVEGDITMETITGVTQTYGRWSLSGTHLMIVVCADVANGTTIPNLDIAFINLPAWILNKINPLIATRIEIKTVPMYDNSFSTQTLTVVLTKGESLLAIVTRSTSVVLNADRKFRIQFDLLIDAS